MVEYHEFMTNNPNTILVRYYAIFNIVYTLKDIDVTQTFVLMENAKRVPDQFVKKVYDMKGSEQGRKVYENHV